MNKLGSRLLAVDPSLRSSGWVLMCVESERPLSAGIVRVQDRDCPLADTLSGIQLQIQSVYEQAKLSADDYVVVEGPAPLVLNPQSAIKVEHVRGIFETLARSRGASVPGRINPRTVHTELLGLSGKQRPRKEVKEIAQAIADKLFSDKLQKVYLAECSGAKRGQALPQDIVDAALVGAVALSKFKVAERIGMDFAEVLAEGSRGFRRGGSGYRWNEQMLKKRSKSASF